MAMANKSYNRIIDHLLQKQIIVQQMVEDLLPQLQENGKQVSTHALLDALIEKYQIDRHAAFSTIAELYAFKQLDLDPEKISDEQVEFIRQIFFEYSEETRELMVQKKVLPFRPHESNRNILIFIAADPIDRDIYPLIRQTRGYSQSRWPMSGSRKSKNSCKRWLMSKTNSSKISGNRFPMSK
jgi:type IV pilus assembly protein PilB